MGGSDIIRGVWDEYFRNANGIIWVIDSTDIERLDDAIGYEPNSKFELHRMLNHEYLQPLKNIKLLILGMYLLYPVVNIYEFNDLPF